MTKQEFCTGDALHVHHTKLGLVYRIAAHLRDIYTIGWSIWDRLIHVPAVVHLTHVHQLLAPADGDLVGILLALQGLDASLHRVHRVSRPRHLGRDVVDAHGPEDFEEPVGGA